MDHGFKLHPDGTLEITLPQGRKVGRVLVCEAGTQDGSLYYPEDISSSQRHENDLISRQSAIVQLSHNKTGDDDYDVVIQNDIETIKALPSAEPECKKGEWIRNNTYHGDDTSGYVDPDWKCSECGENAIVNLWMMYDLTNFCPNCGADMRENHRPEYLTQWLGEPYQEGVNK